MNIKALVSYLNLLGYKVSILEEHEDSIIIEVQGDTSTLNELALNEQLPPNMAAEIIDTQGNKAVIRIVDLEDLIMLDVQRYVNTYIRSGWLR